MMQQVQVQVCVNCDDFIYLNYLLTGQQHHRSHDRRGGCGGPAFPASHRSQDGRGGPAFPSGHRSQDLRGGCGGPAFPSGHNIILGAQA